jgi:hypothetical protein
MINVAVNKFLRRWLILNDSTKCMRGLKGLCRLDGR